jgi:hypothetical protein
VCCSVMCLCTDYLGVAHPTPVCCSKQRGEARAEYSAFPKTNAVVIGVLLKGVVV